MPTSVALNRHFEEFVRAQVASGRYASASEVIRAGLRLLEEQQARNDVRLDELRAALAAGLASGPGLPAEDVLDGLEEKYARMADEPS